MKAFLFIVLGVVVIVIAIQSYTMASVNKIEEQKYTVVSEKDDFEIRYYPSTNIATIKSDAKTYRDLSGPGFRELAGYIFGGNEDNTQISMTAPVLMEINDTVSSMSFVMPSSYDQVELPKPTNPDVILGKTNDEYLAAIRFGGFASDKEYRFYAERLLKMLKDQGIQTIGNPRFLGYNPPYQLAGRRNEVVIPVAWE